MEWEERFSVGIRRFDKDHKILFDLTDQIEKGFADIDSADRIQAVFIVLQDYVLSHFRREETLMADQGYPALAQHKAHHAALAEGLDELRARYGENDNTVLSDLAPFINGWLQVHILEQDKDYVAFFKERLSQQERDNIE